MKIVQMGLLEMNHAAIFQYFMILRERICRQSATTSLMLE